MFAVNAPVLRQTNTNTFLILKMAFIGKAKTNGSQNIRLRPKTPAINRFNSILKRLLHVECVCAGSKSIVNLHDLKVLVRVIITRIF